MGFPVSPRSSRPGLWFGLTLGMAVVSGCGPAGPLAARGVGLNPGPGWTPVARSTWNAPGTALAAWSGPGGASLVAYAGLPAPGATADSLATALANRLENLPGLRVVARKVESVGGQDAARVEAVAAGTGASLAPSGSGAPVAPPGTALVPTRRVSVLIPREGDTLGLLWHAPESDAARLEATVASALATLRVERPHLKTSSY